MTEILRHCLNCKFVVATALQGPDGKLLIGQKAYTCHRFPPHPLLLPSGQPGVVTLTPTFPIVNESISCAEHQFTEKSEGKDSENVPADLKVN